MWLILPIVLCLAGLAVAVLPPVAESLFDPDERPRALVPIAVTVSLGVLVVTLLW